MFIGVLALTLLLILLSYCFDYIIEIIFYSLIDNSEIEEGLLGLISIMRRGKPTFSPICQLIIVPFDLLKHYFLDSDIINFCVTLLSSKVIISLIIVYFESLFYLFRKFGKNGWPVLIPIQNNLILLSISKKPIWWILLLYIPFVKRIVLFFINKFIAEKFNKSTLFSLGIALVPAFFYGEISLNAIDENK